MGELMIRCPKTGKPVTTGIHMERERFGSMPVFFCSSFCPRVRHFASLVCSKCMDLRFRVRGP